MYSTTSETRAEAGMKEPKTKRLAAVTWVAICAAVAGMLGWRVAPAGATINHNIVIKNKKGHTHNIKDMTVGVHGLQSIDGVDLTGPFVNAPVNSPNGKSVKFDGAAIAPDTFGTVTIDLTHKVQGIQDIVDLLEVSWASDPLAFGVSELIFSGAISGGAAGADFAGITIPAGQYLYVYEFGWALGGAGPTRLEVTLPGTGPTSMGVLDNTWTPGALLPVPGPMTYDGDGYIIGQTWEVSPAMLPENLTGVSGVLPDTWGYSAGKMVAEFADPLADGEVSAVLWFTSPLEPSFGGPDPVEYNASLLNDTGTLYAAAVEAPIPEPATLGLLAIGGLALLCRRK